MTVKMPGTLRCRWWREQKKVRHEKNHLHNFCTTLWQLEINPRPKRLLMWVASAVSQTHQCPRDQFWRSPVSYSFVFSMVSVCFLGRFFFSRSCTNKQYMNPYFLENANVCYRWVPNWQVCSRYTYCKSITVLVGNRYIFLIIFLTMRYLFVVI